MFEILYTITDDIKELATLGEGELNCEVYHEIGGYFAFYVNGNDYGLYIKDAIEHDVCGGERITDWFINLILAYNEVARSGYALIDDIDSYIEWIEFEKICDMAKISIIRAEKPDGTFTEVRLTPLEQFEYGRWQDETVKLNDIRTELIKKASQYLDELGEINKKLLKSRDVAELKDLVLQLMRI